MKAKDLLGELGGQVRQMSGSHNCDVAAGINLLQGIESSGSCANQTGGLLWLNRVRYVDDLVLVDLQEAGEPSLELSAVDILIVHAHSLS